MIFPLSMALSELRTHLSSLFNHLIESHPIVFIKIATNTFAQSTKTDTNIHLSETSFDLA
jgi:hypothetical protein